MEPNRLSRTNQTLLAIVMGTSMLLIVLSGVAGYFFGTYERTSKNPPAPSSPARPTKEPSQVLCTTDAKQCPDGSWVGREGPRCEFAPCPNSSSSKKLIIPPPVEPSTAPPRETQSVDFNACTIGAGFNRELYPGSTSLRILRNEQSVCVVSTYNETVDSVSTSQCSVPKSLGTVTFAITTGGTDFSAIKQYCNINSTTHINIGN